MDHPSHDIEEPTSSHKNDSVLLEIVKLSLIALLIVIPVRFFIAQPFIVSGASMEPTFENGQYLIVDQVQYRLEEPQRGDVIIFRFPRDPSKFFIKRIIGLPSETVKIEGNTVTIINSENPEGFVLDESYYAQNMSDDELHDQTLYDDEYFVMGDNRPASADSRVWGTLKENLIVGRALVRLLPISTADVLPGAIDSNTLAP